MMANEDVCNGDEDLVKEFEKDLSLQCKDPTYWKRVRYMNEEHGESQRPWKLKFVENQGYTAYATRSYKAGELILTEFPVVWILGHHPFSSEQIDEIHAKVSALSVEDQAAFYAMANVFSEEEYSKAVGIFMTNCFDMTDSIYGTACAMYLALARLNHSCAPNVQQTHIPETTEEVLFASRDILEGEEMNDCYIELRQTRQNRRKSLLEYYRFTCMCIACNLSDETLLHQNDSIRAEAMKFEEAIIAMVEEGDKLQEALDYGVSVITMMEQPENLIWSIRYLPEAYHIIYQIYQTLLEVSTSLKSKKEYYKLAGKYLKKCVKLNVLTQGDRSPDTIRTAQELQRYLTLKNTIK